MSAPASPDSPATLDYYENWMGNLSHEIADKPIHALAIPGSHDSFSYSITRTSPVAPEDDNLSFINKLPSCMQGIAKRIVYRWSYTQRINATQQLQRGVRYFDFRVSPKPDTGEVCLVHGLYGMSVYDALKEINEFLATHPKEVVILDFQHFYNVTDDVHVKIIADILDIFGAKLCPFKRNLNQLTMASLWSNAYQAFVFYRCAAASQSHLGLWPAAYLPNPWPETVEPQQMVDFLETNYRMGRPANKFYVAQGILTPDTRYVVHHFFNTLEETLVGAANTALLAWLQDKSAGVNGVNVVISDFVSSSDVVKTVIALNTTRPERPREPDKVVEPNAV